LPTSKKENLVLFTFTTISPRARNVKMIQEVKTLGGKSYVSGNPTIPSKTPRPQSFLNILGKLFSKWRKQMS